MIVPSLSFDQLAHRVGRRHLREILDEEVEAGRVELDDEGRFALAHDLDRGLLLALRGLDGAGAMLEQPWPTRGGAE
jgi:hypothetical protein